MLYSFIYGHIIYTCKKKKINIPKNYPPLPAMELQEVLTEHVINKDGGAWEVLLSDL